MKRGGILLLAILNLVAVLPARPAPAAEQPYVVEEIVNVGRSRASTVTVYILAETEGEPGLVAFYQLAPRKGGGWTQARFSLVMYNDSDTRFATYPVASPVCPGPVGFCGNKGDGGFLILRLTFRPAAGNRYFVAGPADKAFAIPTTPGWGARSVALGARVVTAPGAAAAGAVANGQRVEAFATASAPGGAYGSGVFAMAPCDGEHSVGSASVKSDGSDKAVPIPCEPRGYYAAFSSTLDGRTWTETGPVVGDWVFPYRLFVVDWPKR